MQTFEYKAPFNLESGAQLPNFRLAYHVWGDLNNTKPVFWVCHALTANSNVSEWWPGLFGQGLLLDPTRYTIVCANMLGSCYGSTHALSQNPKTQTPYYQDFPLLTNRDISRAFELLRQYLGIEHISLALGGSLGGQQLLEWAYSCPEVFQRLFLIATNARHSAWGIAFNEAQRMAINADSTWGQQNPKAGLKGMGAARSMALLSYRHYQAYVDTQSDSDTSKLSDYKVVSYQQHQANKLMERFNAFTYMSLSKAMDSQNLARGRTSLENELQKITAKALVMGITSDVLFPIQEQFFLAQNLKNAHFESIESSFGHDGFLLENDKIMAACQRRFPELLL